MDDLEDQQPSTDLRNHDQTPKSPPPTDPELDSRLHTLDQREPQLANVSRIPLDALQDRAHEEPDAEHIENGLPPETIPSPPRSANDGLDPRVQQAGLSLNNDEGLIVDPSHHPGPQEPPTSQLQHDLNQEFMTPRNKEMEMPSYPSQPLPQTLVPHFQSPPQLEVLQPGGTNQNDGHFKNMKLVADPPDLQKWREKLFNVEDTIVLSEEECASDPYC